MLALVALLPASGFAKDIRLGPVQTLVDFDVAYGVRWRVEDRDDRNIAILSGGTNPLNSNQDDGNLNYNQGDVVSNIARTTGELTFKWKNFGAFVRGYAFYDYENSNNNRARTELKSLGKDQVARGAEVLDAYLSAEFTIGQIPLRLRLGDQVVGWGESNFFGTTGINVVNPLNLPLAQQPTSTPRDLRTPVGMLWAVSELTSHISLEAYYQYEWVRTTLPARGTFLSSNDVAAPDAEFIVFSPEVAVDLPGLTDLDAAFGLPPGTLGSAEDFSLIQRALPDEEAGDDGQWGVGLRAVVPEWNDSTIGLYFANYHSKTPTLYWTTPPEEAFDAFSPETVAEQAAQLKPIYEAGGLSPEEAAQQAGNTALTLGTTALAEQGVYGKTYGEDIQMFGLSFNTTTIQTGTAISGEVAYHRGVPMGRHLGDIIPALLFPIPGAPDTGPPVPGARVDASVVLDQMQMALGVTQLFGPKLGASKAALTAEVAWLHVFDFPDKNEVKLAPGGAMEFTEFRDELFPDEDSWGYRIAGSLTYPNIFRAINLKPAVVWIHDVDGISTGGVPFRRSRKTLALSLSAQYLNSLELKLSYRNTWGAGRFNIANDRDFIQFVVRYAF